MYSVEYNSIKDKSYKEVSLDVTRLRYELERRPNEDVDQDGSPGVRHQITGHSRLSWMLSL